MTDWDDILNFDMSKKPMNSKNFMIFLEHLKKILEDMLHEDMENIMEKVNIILGDKYKW